MQLECVGVAGLGLLGRGIAGCLLSHGLRVVVYERAESVLAPARAAIGASLDELRQRGMTAGEATETWQSRYREASSIEEFATCDFVIESIIESAAAKLSLFDELEKVLPPNVPIASNTSALPITQLQHGRKHPARFLGMHWAEPAHATRFLELIRGEETNDSTMQAALKLAVALGKEPCVVQRDVPGFIANRLGYAMYREACNLLASGVADAETIDTSFRNSVGLWASVCGPFRWIDLTGGPALYANAMEGVLPTLSQQSTVPEPLATMRTEGLTGIRGGEGFYSYTAEQAAAWEQIYRQQVWRVRDMVNETFPLATEGH